MDLLAVLGLTRSRRSPAPAVPTFEPHGPHDPRNAAAFPRVDPGLPRQSVQQLLAPHESLLSRTKLCYGMDRLGFERDLLDPIQRFACFVNALPATADNFFCESGGLLRLALETGFFALQGTDGQIVAGRATISARRELEPRWRQATYLAGLCCELHRTLGHIVVTDTRGEPWPAYLMPMTTWLEQQASTTYRIRWLDRAHASRALGLFALPHIVPTPTLQRLASDSAPVVPHLLACLSGSALSGETNVLADLVHRAAALVIDRDLVARAARHGRPILGAHLDHYVVEAMRRLVATDAAWSPNAERSRVWYGSDGLFVVWPNAATDLCRLFDAEALPGMPRAPATLLEVLLAAGAVVGQHLHRPLWSIVPPGSSSPLQAIKIALPAILLAGEAETTKPLGRALVFGGGACAPATEQPSAITSNLAADSTEHRVPRQGSTVSPAVSAPTSATAPATADLIEANALSEPPAQAQQELALEPPAEPFTLNAPLRLNPQVRDALAAAVATLNSPSTGPTALTIPTGVFVPLAIFKRARLDVTMAVRALAELAMIDTSKSGKPRTVEHELDGACEPGVVLRPAFVRGLPAADASRSE